MEREGEMEGLTEEERRALRGSKFAPLPSPTPRSLSQPRLAHPGGPLRTNKAAALRKFLDRKLQGPGGLASINPDLLDLAVTNAKQAANNSSGTSNAGRTVQHVASFDEDSTEEKEVKDSEPEKQNKKKKKKKKRKNKKQKIEVDPVKKKPKRH